MAKLFEKRVSESDTLFLAQEILEKKQDAHVFVFQGNLGAGKTTLVRKLCDALKVTDEVSSPTFGLLNIYQTAQADIQICHADLYRLKDEAELETIGIWDYLDDPSTICLIEWPELILNQLSISYLHITLSHTEEQDRVCKVEYFN